MFDRTFVNHSEKEYVPYEKTVKEFKAPTDESIRLYEEIRDKAFKQILGSMVISGNTLKGKCLAWQDHFGYERGFLFQLEINGEHHDIKMVIPHLESPAETAQKFVSRLSELIAQKITKDLSYEILKVFKGIR